LADVVTDPAEKASALTALMEKLQPEGGYAPIDPEDARYKQMLKAVAVVRVSIEEITAKFKFGQNLSEARREIIISRLEERGRPDDAATAGLMRAYAPSSGTEE
jgi:predicted FMN-binding regulatory protein PaiB